MNIHKRCCVPLFIKLICIYGNEYVGLSFIMTFIEYINVKVVLLLIEF